MVRVTREESTAGGITPEHTAAVEFLKRYPAIVQEALAAALKSLGAEPPENRKWRPYPAEFVLRAHEDVPETSRNPDDGDKASKLRAGDTEYRADNIFVSEEEDPILHALIAEVQRKTAGKMPQSLLTVALAGVRLACDDVQLLVVTFKDSTAKQLSAKARLNIMAQQGDTEELDFLDKMMEEQLELGHVEGRAEGRAQERLLVTLQNTYPELQKQELLSQLEASVYKLDQEQILEVRKHLGTPFEQISAFIMGLKKDPGQHSDTDEGGNNAGPANSGLSKKDDPGSP
jgi:hypothetical protein